MRTDELKTIPFPDCTTDCELVEMIGVGECESACGWKFDDNGNPIEE